MSKRIQSPVVPEAGQQDCPEGKTFGGSCSDLYQFAPNAPARSIQNHLENRLYQLKGMLALTYGEGDELLQSLDPDLRQGFMWACSELLDEVILLAQRRSSRPAEDES